MRCQGVRGATTVEKNTSKEIINGTRELLQAIIKENKIQPKDIASVIFTTTKDLNAEYPALAARKMGWYDQALLCGHEMDVPGGLDKCIRILLHWNTNNSTQEIQHVYLNGAEELRPERAIETIETE